MSFSVWNYTPTTTAGTTAETDAPTSVTDTPTSGTDIPTSATNAPTSVTDIPTDPTDAGAITSVDTEAAILSQLRSIQIGSHLHISIDFIAESAVELCSSLIYLPIL